MRVAIPIMIWRRPDVVEIWARRIKCLQKSFPNIDFFVSITGSEGDISRNLAHEFGFDYYEHPNVPIGAKANFRLQTAKKYDPDFVWLMSDDFLPSNATFHLLLKGMNHGLDEQAFMDIYHFNLHTKEFAYSLGYKGQDRDGEPVAPGRMLSRRMCDAMDWIGWNANERYYLDGWIMGKLLGIEHTKAYYRLKDERIFNIEIKSSVNMTPFQWFGWWQKENVQTLKKYLPEEETRFLL